MHDALLNKKTLPSAIAFFLFSLGIGCSCIQLAWVETRRRHSYTGMHYFPYFLEKNIIAALFYLFFYHEVESVNICLTGFQWFDCRSWFWRTRNWITTSAYSYSLVEHKRKACQGLPGHNARCKAQVLACFSCVCSTSWFQYLFRLKLEEIRYEAFFKVQNHLRLITRSIFLILYV